MIDQADVVVIGAGSFGSSTAYHLAKLGMRNVVLVDRFEPGSQTSPRAAGLASQDRLTGLDDRLGRCVRGCALTLALASRSGQHVRHPTARCRAERQAGERQSERP